MMDIAAAKRNARRGVRPLVRGLDRLGVSPLGVSAAGLLVTAVSGLVVASGHLLWGAVTFLLGSALDMLDGDLARLQGTVSPRGAFLDSCFDRLGEAFLFCGLTWHFATAAPRPDPLPLVLILVTVVGSLTTSYVRARAEGVGQTCQVGFLQRTERVVLLAAGLAVGRAALVPVLGFLAVATMATTVQRMVHVAGKLPGPRAVPEADRPAPPGETAAGAGTERKEGKS